MNKQTARTTEELLQEGLPTTSQLSRELKRVRYNSGFNGMLRSTIGILITVAAIAVLIAVLLLPVLQIYGTSMSPTMNEGDIMVSVKGTKFETGEVVAFYYNNKILVKRVIANAGEWVNLDQEGNVYVNNKKLDEPYIAQKAYGETNIELPYQVPDSRIFVIGDNRDASIDSRNTSVGCVSDEQIVDGTTVSEDQLAKMREKAEANTDYKAFKGKSAIGFIGNDEDVIKMDNASRPALPIQQWMDKMNDANGKRLGVMSCLARGRADNSYSSGQIEVSISWASFAEDQKMLERQVVDYVCDILCPGVAYTVTWPEAFEIDPQKSEATKDARLRGGRTTFEEMLGPYWQQKLLQLAKEKRFLEENGLENLSFFQSVSGASAEIKTDDNTTNKGEQQ